LILLPVEYFNGSPPDDFSKVIFFLLSYGLLSSLLAFRYPLAGKSLLRSYYIFFILFCFILAVAAVRAVNLVGFGMLLAPVIICWIVVRSLRTGAAREEQDL
jgi:hypothetical protein